MANICQTLHPSFFCIREHIISCAARPGTHNLPESLWTWFRTTLFTYNCKLGLQDLVFRAIIIHLSVTFWTSRSNNLLTTEMLAPLVRDKCCSKRPVRKALAIGLPYNCQPCVCTYLKSNLKLKSDSVKIQDNLYTRSLCLQLGLHNTVQVHIWCKQPYMS